MPCTAGASTATSRGRSICSQPSRRYWLAWSSCRCGRVGSEAPSSAERSSPTSRNGFVESISPELDDLPAGSVSNTPGSRSPSVFGPGAGFDRGALLARQTPEPETEPARDQHPERVDPQRHLPASDDDLRP